MEQGQRWGMTQVERRQRVHDVGQLEVALGQTLENDERGDPVEGPVEARAGPFSP